MSKEKKEVATTAEAAPPAPTVPATFYPRGEVAGLNAGLKMLREGGYQVLGPTAMAPVIPEGFGVALNVIRINPEPPKKNGQGGGGDVYRPDWRDDDAYAFTKTLLDRIAGAHGVKWHPTSSKRLDTGRDPLYCHFRAVGSVMDFDGTVRTITGEKEIDLREGGSLRRSYKAQIERALAKDEKAPKRGTPAWDKQVAERLQSRVDQVHEHILSLAESKAKNRAIRSALAIKSKYSGADLKRPLVVLKLVPAPETIEDPDVRKQVMIERMRGAMGIAGALFGEGEELGPALLDVTPGAEVPHDPPPVAAEPEKPAEAEAEDDDEPPVTDEDGDPF